MPQVTSSHSGLFGTLPTELQLAIFVYLNYPSALFLSSVNKYFQRDVRPLELVSAYQKAAFVRSAQQFPRHVRGRAFGCFRCYRVLPQQAFAEKQITGRRNKGNSKESYRFCLECGEEGGVYTRGSQVRKSDGILYWKCSRCPALKSGLYCTICMQCHDCLRLTPEFDGKWCPKCKMDGIEGEKRHVKEGRALGAYEVDLLMSLGTILQMAEWESEFGERASPEWFDDWRDI